MTITPRTWIGPLLAGIATLAAIVMLTAFPGAAHAATPDGPCTAYVYTGSTHNLCDKFPGAGPAKVRCADVGYRVSLVRDGGEDPWGLDGGGASQGTVGVGCESYPIRVFSTPAPSQSTSVKPSTSASNPHHVSSTPNPPVNGPQGGRGALAVTGPSGWVFAALSVGVAAFGGVLLIAARRRRINFKA